MRSKNEKTEIDIQKAICRFLTFLRSSWDTILDCAKYDPFESLSTNWLQANWELLVEGTVPIPGFALEVYGDGADLGTSSSRLLYPERLPTHKIICTPVNTAVVYDYLNDVNLNTQEEPLVFERFVTLIEGWYYESNPFDYVLAYNGNTEAVVRLGDILFKLSKGGLDESKH